MAAAPGISPPYPSMPCISARRTCRNPIIRISDWSVNAKCLIKAHVTDPATPASPAVTAVLNLGGQTLNLPLTGPATLPASIPDGLGVVQHSFANTFTATIPAAWVKTGLQVTVNAGPASVNFTNMKVGAPTKVVMTMFDVNYFCRCHRRLSGGNLRRNWKRSGRWRI